MDEEVKALITEGFQELRGQLRDTRGELKEMRLELGVVVEHMDERFAQVDEAFQVITERLERTALQEDMERGFSNMNALITSSFANHERRIRALEQKRK